MATAYCAECGLEIADAENVRRHPCPECGATARRIEETISDTITFRESISIKAKSPGEKRPFMEEKAGDDLHRATGRWNKLTRLIDRRGDHYFEEIIDGETGETIRRVDEPLSKHTD